MVKKTLSSKKPAATKKAKQKQQQASSSSKPVPAQQQQQNSPPPAPAPASASGLRIPAEQQQQQQQQRLLDIFSDAFSRVLTSDGFPTLLREVKQALFHREFAVAFGREAYLEAYAARWSPTRALCYASVLLSIRGHVSKLVVGSRDEEEEEDKAEAGDVVASSEDVVEDERTTAKEPASSPPTSAVKDGDGTLRMVCIGGCAAEHLAFASYLASQSLAGRLTLLDSAPWSSVIALLETKTTSPPPLSRYASAAAKASNRAALLEPRQLSLTCMQQDALALDASELAAVVAGDDGPVVVTMMFTLNELYTSGGIAKTTKLLKNLGDQLADGSLLLVVDSPGSYSEAAVGKEKKRYPMQWLLDHTLMGTETPQYTWEKLESNESIWFRLPEGLSYPIPLENMRYQLHMYRLGKVS